MFGFSIARAGVLFYGLHLKRLRPEASPVRYFVILVLVLIIASLGSALFYVFRDRGSSSRAVKALAIRVGLSIGLFLLLMAGYYFGFIPGRL